MRPVPETSPAGNPPLLRTLDAVGLALTLAAATTSDSVFQIDEHFQVVEFAGYKLGVTPPGELAWEFPARIRPWLQPGAYVLLARALHAVGVESPFPVMRGYRIASGLAAWAAIVALLLAVRHWFPSPRWRRAAYLSLTLPYFVPYLAARISSESLATTFLLLGVAILVAPGAGEPGKGGAE